MLDREKQEEIIMAHKYLYYVLCKPIISDFEYDKLCEEIGIYGGGGSDREQDYPQYIKNLAQTLIKNS